MECIWTFFSEKIHLNILHESFSGFTLINVPENQQIFRQNLSKSCPAIFCVKSSCCQQIVDDDVSGHSPEGPIHPPSPFLIIANKISKGPVILNVGGKRHEVIINKRLGIYLFLSQSLNDDYSHGLDYNNSVQVRWNTLDKYPTSRLGRLRSSLTSKVFLWYF